MGGRSKIRWYYKLELEQASALIASMLTPVDQLLYILGLGKLSVLGYTWEKKKQIIQHFHVHADYLELILFEFGVKNRMCQITMCFFCAT